MRPPIPSNSISFHSISLLLQVLDQIDHLRMAHGRGHGAVPFVQDPKRKNDPEAVEEGEVEPAAR